MERIPVREKSSGGKTGEKRRVRSSAGRPRGQKIADEFAFFFLLLLFSYSCPTFSPLLSSAPPLSHSQSPPHCLNFILSEK